MAAARRRLSQRLRAALNRLLPRLLPLVAPLLIIAAAFIVRRQFNEISGTDLADALRRIPNPAILTSAALTALAYFFLALSEWFAVLFGAGRLRFPLVAVISFACTAVGHNFGNAVFVGGALRARMYAAQGLGAVAISRVVVFHSLAYWIGYLILAGLLFIFDPPPDSGRVHIPPLSLQVIGGGFLLLALAYFGVSAEPSGGFARKLTRRWTQFRVPPLRIAASQAALNALDLACAAGALYVLLNLGSRLPFNEFLAIYLLALIAGIASQVPGGLGIFETAMLLLLRDALPIPALVGGLLVFRLVFYFIPFALALAVLLIFELRLRWTRAAHRPFP